MDNLSIFVFVFSIFVKQIMSHIHNCQVCKRLGRQQCPYPSNQNSLLYSFRNFNQKRSQSLQKFAKTTEIDRKQSTFMRHSQSNPKLTQNYKFNEISHQRQKSQHHFQYFNPKNVQTPLRNLNETNSMHQWNAEYFTKPLNQQISQYNYRNSLGLQSNQFILSNGKLPQDSTIQYTRQNQVFSGAPELLYYPIYPVYQISQQISIQGEQEILRSNRNSFSYYPS